MKSLLCLLLLTIRLMADGTFVPRTGTLAPVEIPGQTAVLEHHDGTQTLTVWNTVKSDSAELAWVLPLPSPPSVIQQTDTRPLRALQIATAPRVSVADVHPELAIFLPVALLMSILMLFARRRFPQHHFYGCMAMMGGGLLALTLLGLYSFSAGGVMRGDSGGPVTGVQVLAQQMTGNYETTVIRSSSAEAVDEWLKSRGFRALTGDQLEAVREYSAKDWVFLCAKLSASAAGGMATHPLTVKFASATPVYPMRLTRSAGTVNVQLFVLSAGWVHDPSERLRAEWQSGAYAGKVLGYMKKVIDSTALEEGAQELQIPWLIPENKDALLDALRRAKVVTRLSGTFTPGSDWQDVQLKDGVPKSPVRGYATRAALFMESIGRTGFAGGVCILALALVAHVLTKPGNRPRIGWLAAALCVPAAMAGIGAAAAFPSGGVSADGRRVVAGSAVQFPQKQGENPVSLTDEWLVSLRPSNEGD